MEDDKEDDPGEAIGDDEPSLGSIGMSGRFNQTMWAIGSRDEREDDTMAASPLCGIQVQRNGGDNDGVAELGSPDGIVDQRLTTLDSGISWSVADGEEAD